VDMGYLYEHVILSFMAVLFSLSMAYVIGYICVHYNSIFLCLHGWLACDSLYSFSYPGLDCAYLSLFMIYLCMC